VGIFLALVAFIFWVGQLAEKPVVADVRGEGTSPADPETGPGLSGPELQPAPGD
jgi:hypothetical protein